MSRSKFQAQAAAKAPTPRTPKVSAKTTPVPPLGDNLAQAIVELSPQQREDFLSRLPYGAATRVQELLTEHATDTAAFTVKLLPHQIIPPPEEIEEGHLLAGGRGTGKTLGVANYLARLAERTPGLRARVIAPTLADAVNAVALDPQSGILAHSPSARYVASGAEGVRVVWPNKAVVFLVGTPTLKDVDRLRALTNIDCDAFEEAAANPQLAAAVTQAALSRRGNRLHHPVWIGASTPRPTPAFKALIQNPRVKVVSATTADNPHTPQAYREYAESLRGTRMYRQEVLGEVLADVEGALWGLADVERSIVTDPDARRALLSVISRCVVGVDPATGGGTVGIVVVGVTDAERDPLGFSRLVVLDDFSVTEASPNTWGQRVISAYMAYGFLAPIVVAEKNQGGLMVASTILTAVTASGLENPVPVSLITSMVSKARRATPIALLWEVDPQRAVIAPPNGDVTRITLLTDQLTDWVPGAYSPDRLDALTVGASFLTSGPTQARGELVQPVVSSAARHSSQMGFRQALRGGIEEKMRALRRHNKKQLSR